jgi:tetratricopeptide (TPR) repeat protein
MVYRDNPSHFVSRKRFNRRIKVSSTLAEQQVKAALAAVESAAVSTAEKIDMLMEIAMGLQQKPKSVQQLHDAVALYERALTLCPPQDVLLTARLRARKATALQTIPGDDPAYLQQAQDEMETALSGLREHGRKEEIAEAEMNLGLIIQSLAGVHLAVMSHAITAYQRALRTFTRDAYPTEFAIIHNNLATAYLSIPMTDEHAKMREALAVQSFEQALQVVTLIDQPIEYAMLQNNLGNALQYASSSHQLENNYRALEAYDEALKVRNCKDTPLEYANTIANKANALCNLPDDPGQPAAGNVNNLMMARRYYQEAKDLFQQFGDTGKAALIDDMLQQLATQLGTGEAGSRQGYGFGNSRIS